MTVANDTLEPCVRCHAPIPDAEARFCTNCGAAVEGRDIEDTLVGQVVLGRYRVERVIGEGGMGRVYVASQQIGDATRNVAVKAISPALSRDPQMVARIQREAATIVKLTHPATVKLHDFGEERGQFILVMEYAPGPRLADELARGPMPLAKALPILAQIAGSLDDAHAQGVVHRDLKPENVILTSDATGAVQVKVVDFGIAKQIDRLTDSPAITQRGVLLGTPAYMSPEQCLGIEVDARSDVYALGLLAYRMLAGALPWTGRNVYEWISLHVREAAPQLEGKTPGLPRRVYAAVHKALAKSPPDRQRTAGEFVRELAGMPDGAEPWTLLHLDAKDIGRASQLPTSDGTPRRRVQTTLPDPMIPAAAPPRATSRAQVAWTLVAVFVVAASLTFSAVAYFSRRPRPARYPHPGRAPATQSDVSNIPIDAARDASVVDADLDAEDPHPNWPQAQRHLVRALDQVAAGELDAAVTSLDSAQRLIGPTSPKLSGVQAEVAALASRRITALLRARRCADARALAIRVRRVGAEGEAYRAFGGRCTAP